MDRDRNRLDAAAWVEAAYAAFESAGVEAVKVERLANDLGVTRGSFYWHFKHRGDLLRAVLQRWDAVQTEALILGNEADGGSAAVRLSRMLALCCADDGRFEMGVRAWAATDPAARELVARIDGRRTQYLATLLEEAGAPSALAAPRAEAAYAAWIGLYAGAYVVPEERRRAVMAALHQMLVGDL